MLGVHFEVGEPSNFRSTSQISYPSTHVHLSEEELAAEDSFSLYSQPMELYNILMHRAKENPSFLNRCLNYRIKAKHKRIKIKVSLSLRIDETENVLPLYICLARQSPNNRDAEYFADYRASRIFKFQDSPEIDGGTEVEAKFKLPEVNKLAEEAKSGSLYILVFTTVKNRNSSSEANANPVPFDESAGELCLCGKASFEFLCCAWDCSSSFVSGQRAEMVSTVDLVPCFLKGEGPIKNHHFSLEKCVEKDQSISIQAPCNSYNEKLQIVVSSEEYGAKERSPFFIYSSHDILSPSLARLIRLREQNVLFNYRYYNNKLKKTEVTEDFACPLCLVRCGSYKGLRYHMDSSHDLFDFEFSADQSVNVSIKPDVLEVIRSNLENGFSLFKIVGDVKPQQEIFVLRNELPFKRQFYHSTKYQPMSVEEVLSGHNSEDEIDDDTKDIEHRMLIDDCEDVTKDEKEIMFMWSSFVRRQRVVADYQIPWACNAFTKLHSHVLIQSPQLALCWRLLMIKLWNHNLIGGEVMNACSIILEEYQKQNSHPPS